jgi:23S rRNA pseudouridine1911/1915/1917 synthase
MRLAAVPGFPEDAVFIVFDVPREHSGVRLDRFLQWCIPRLSRTRAQEIIRACAYRMDGTKRRPSDRVRFGETVLLVREKFQEPETPLHFDVVYEDEALLAVDKPAGLPVHPSATYYKNTLTWLLHKRYGDAAPRLAHRLDRETSGVMLCAKSLDDERELKQQFEQRNVHKRYVAMVRGQMPETEGRIEVGLRPSRAGLHLLMEASHEPDALAALTEFRVRERTRDASLVELWPHTGRQHQLRVHLAFLGHPIVGDKLYGPLGSAVFEEYILTGMTDALCSKAGHHRHALHAECIEFPHPRTGAMTQVTAPLPHDLQALWESFER